MKRIIVLLITINVIACAHQPATWQRSKQAAYDAAVHPSVWAPLLGAGIFSIGHLDKNTSTELSEDNPVFGSKKSAGKVSGKLKGMLTDVAILSAFVTPVPNDENVIEHYGDHLAVIFAGFQLNGDITDGLKKKIGRQRPNQEDDLSFPSGNASKAFTAATFASKNFHRAWGDSSTTQWADAGLYTAAGLEAWTRVETEKHYPSDVLAGAALGSFIARFLDELFLQENNNLSLSAYYDGNLMSIGIKQDF